MYARVEILVGQLKVPVALEYCVHSPLVAVHHIVDDTTIFLHVVCQALQILGNFFFQLCSLDDTDFPVSSCTKLFNLYQITIEIIIKSY